MTRAPRKIERRPGETTRPEEPGSKTGSHVLWTWRWPAVVVFVSVLVFVAVRIGCRVVSDTTRGAISALGDVADLGEGFRTETITTTFISALPRLAPDSRTRLELVAVEATETFTRVNDRRVFYDMVPLGETVSEIRVPVTYRYHLALDDPWRIVIQEHACIVHAPPIRATLPPGIDTGGMEKHSSSGWLRFDSDEEMAELERNLTELMSRRASDPDSIDLVRELCRRRVADFVRNWLLAEDHWRDDRFRSVTVIFADEQPEDASLVPPSLVLDSHD